MNANKPRLKTSKIKHWPKETGKWLATNYIGLIVVLAIILFVPWLWLSVYLSTIVIDSLDGVLTATVPEDRRSIAYTLGVSLTAIAGMIASPLILIKTWISERQAKTAEHSHITSRLSKANEQLGATRQSKYRSRVVKYRMSTKHDAREVEVIQREGELDPVPAGATDSSYGPYDVFEETLPAIEVRVGAILALERIARDSESDHVAVMEKLCAYIRENAPESQVKDHELGRRPVQSTEGGKDLSTEWEQQLERWIDSLSYPRIDIQLALDVIARRSDERIRDVEQRWAGEDDSSNEGYRLNLSHTNLRKASLSRAKFQRAVLVRTRLEGAQLHNANLAGC